MFVATPDTTFSSFCHSLVVGIGEICPSETVSGRATGGNSSVNSWADKPPEASMQKHTRKKDI